MEELQDVVQYQEVEVVDGDHLLKVEVEEEHLALVEMLLMESPI